ncbi:helix-turn-helix transcriptional regulator [Aneurinibacillus thermoaerophilus]|uniref:helix-turn-helix domain-containing protein n=1 Tax=Aneurinibacillus thermoaerophilus TaxID=143495 RepID=UPI002E1C7183|nr:helix-turn-helix transcriptional regulator [Aneurinibacillus thermoaerophilus]
MISFEPLRILMVKRNMKKKDLVSGVPISQSTAAKIGKDEYVSLKVIDDICQFLDCEISDIIEHRKEKKE